MGKQRALYGAAFDFLAFDVDPFEPVSGSAEAWTDKAKQAETWTPATKQSEVWTDK